MKLKTIEDVNAFTAAIDKCIGPVWLESIYGDRYQLKSKLSQYIAIGALLNDNTDDLELFASFHEDRSILMAFLSNLNKENN